jgi:hypothetical protein
MSVQARSDSAGGKSSGVENANDDLYCPRAGIQSDARGTNEQSSQTVRSLPHWGAARAAAVRAVGSPMAFLIAFEADIAGDTPATATATASTAVCSG